MHATPLNKASGFTLIEIMVVVVIVAILTMIALPTYTEYVRRSNRADAMATLLEAQQLLQRWYTENDAYDRQRGEGSATVTPATLGASRQSPQSGTAIYTAQFLSLSPTGYTLAMVPVTGGTMASDKCGTFVVDHLGARTVQNATVPAAQCWRR